MIMVRFSLVRGFCAPRKKKRRMHVKKYDYGTFFFGQGILLLILIS